MEKKPSKYKIQKEEIPDFNLSPEVERLQNQLDKDPNSKVFLPLAEEYRRSKMPEEAIFILEEGIKRNPSYTAAKIALARSYMEINEVMKAKKVIDEILAKMPHNPLALKLHGDISFREGDFAEAKKAYQTAKTINPLDIELDKKLSDLQTSESGSKIEVAALGEQENEMEIERSYIEHRTPAQPMAGAVSNPIQPETNQFVPPVVPPPPIPGNFQPQFSYGQDQPGEQQNIYQGQENQAVPQPPVDFSQYQEPFQPQNQGYVQPQPENLPGDALPYQQFQPDVTAVSNENGVAAFEPNQTGYDQQTDQSAYGVPLVSQEVVVPERNYSLPEQYGLSPETQSPDTFQPIIPQTFEGGPFDLPEQSEANAYNIQQDVGGFYTGPPTEPFVEEVSAGYPQESENSYQVPQEFGTVSEELPQSYEPQPQPADFGSVIIDQKVSSNSVEPSLQEQNAELNVEEIYKDIDLSSLEKQPAEEVVSNQTVKVEEFGLNELESQVDIPEPVSVNIADQMKNAQPPAAVPPMPAKAAATGEEERITIDSLDIEDVNLDALAAESSNAPNTNISINDLASAISYNGSPSETKGVVDIFQKPTTSAEVSLPGQQHNAAKYNMDLAELYTKQGHFDKALEIYKMLLESQPDNQDIINRLIETEKMKNADQEKSQSVVSPTERIAKMEEWFRSISKGKNEK